MKLKWFQILSYRSVNDSSKINVEQRTALVGRNEAGKSSLLRALYALKPPEDKLSEFTLARDFPRDRARSEFSKDTKVVETSWELSAEEREELGEIWTRAAAATSVEIGRWYEGKRWVSFEGIADLEQSVDHAREATKHVAKGLKTAATKAHKETTPLDAPLAELEAAVDQDHLASGWAHRVAVSVAALRTAAQGAQIPISETLAGHFEAIVSSAKVVGDDEKDGQAARNWAVKKMPVFVYLDEWDLLPGHYDIEQYVQRTTASPPAPTAEDRLFAKLLKVAELDAAELRALLGKSHEERKLLTDRASRVFTKTLRSLWKDRQLTVEFNVDERHFDIHVSDVDTQALVNLNERSRGFRWYFSFFVTFAADTQGGDKENAILLLDEPGLFLHATAQSALLKFFETLPNQLIYSTHSPFMIDPAQIACVRTVTLNEGEGTRVSDVPTGDANTLFPLQAALGYDLTQTLFVGSKNLVVEGVTDYWYLSTVSDHLRETGQGMNRDIVITPAGGAPKVPYMVALLTAQKLSVAVLLDQEPQGQSAASDLVKTKLIRDDGVILAGSAFDPKASAADVEDLLDPAAFIALVEESYSKELGGRKLTLDSRIPRVVRRVEAAFNALGIPFNKTRPAKLFLRKMGTDTLTVLGKVAEDRFARLFDQVNKAIGKIEKRAAFM